MRTMTKQNEIKDTILEEAVRLRIKGLSFEQIGKTIKPKERKTAFSSETVKRALEKYIPNKYIDKSHSTELTATARQKTIDAKYKMTLAGLTQEKLEEASYIHIAQSSKMLHEQIRLEENKSTQNIETKTFAILIEKSFNNEDGM